MEDFIKQRITQLEAQLKQVRKWTCLIIEFSSFCLNACKFLGPGWFKVGRGNIRRQGEGNKRTQREDKRTGEQTIHRQSLPGGVAEQGKRTTGVDVAIADTIGQIDVEQKERVNE